MATNERYRLVGEIFQSALHLEPSSRDEYPVLSTVCDNTSHFGQ